MLLCIDLSWKILSLAKMNEHVILGVNLKHFIKAFNIIELRNIEKLFTRVHGNLNTRDPSPKT